MLFTLKGQATFVIPEQVLKLLLHFCNLKGKYEKLKMDIDSYHGSATYLW